MFHGRHPFIFCFGLGAAGARAQRGLSGSAGDIRRLRAMHSCVHAIIRAINAARVEWHNKSAPLIIRTRTSSGAAGAHARTLTNARVKRIRFRINIINMHASGCARHQRYCITNVYASVCVCCANNAPCEIFSSSGRNTHTHTNAHNLYSTPRLWEKKIRIMHVDRDAGA